MNSVWSKPIDFFARRIHFVDHLAPIWSAMDAQMRGAFYVPVCLASYAKSKGIDASVLKPPGVNDPLLVVPGGDGPLVVCAYGDLVIAHRKNPKRPMIYLEHGVGLSFNHPAYAGGMGMKKAVSLFLDPNEHVRAKNKRTFPSIEGVVVGTPKMDPLPALPQMGKNVPFRGGKPVVCISFHWDGKAIAAEAGNALGHYRGVLGELARCEEFTLIGHGHPRIIDQLENIYKPLGIEVVRDFSEVMERADLYVNDCSSTMYEFCVSGKPVIILNAPSFRRNVHTGIRFWEYADVGPQVDRAEDLLSVIREQLSTGSVDAYRTAREKAVAELYPYLGKSAVRAAEVIQDFVKARMPVLRKVETVENRSVGIVYMGFGAKAAAAIGQSVASLRAVGFELPVCVVGDVDPSLALPNWGGNVQFIKWTGESPYDASQRENFQFRAGRVKPFLYELSPFERTLYIDADTEFVGDIMPGFEMLGEYQMALAEEKLTIGKLYNKPRAGWEVNIKERDETIKELGGDPNRKFLNSGVIFFRKSEVVEEVFAEWSRQWQRFQQWDEQLALMRALNIFPAHYKALSLDWNNPHREKAKIIFHNYGRGVVRENVDPLRLRRVPPNGKEQERHLGEEKTELLHA